MTELVLSALEQTGEGVAIVDLTGSILYINHAFADMHGYTADELLGVNLSVFHLPERMPSVDAANRQVLETGSFSGEIIHLHRDGTEFPALMQSSLVTDDEGLPIGIVGTIRNMTDLKNTIQELEDTKRMLNSVLNAIPDVIGIQDTEHGVISYNSAGYAFLQMTEQEVTGKKCYELIGRMVPCEKCATSLTYKSLKPERIEKYIPDLDTWLDVRAYPILNEAGELVKVIEHLRDVSDIKEAESRSRKLEEQVRITQKLESLGVLAGGIAHDFNNILMAILGNADLALKEEADSEAVHGYLNDIKSAARRAAELAGQMLDYSGRSEPQKTPVDVNMLIKETAHMLSVSVSKKTTLEYNLCDEIPAVLADPVQLQQVIMNLITNASEALDNHPGTVILSTSQKKVSRKELAETYVNDELAGGSYVIVSVKDNGSGMDPATMSRVFDPFFTTKFTGRGLGLAAVLGMIRAHKGAVQVYSSTCKGSEFKVFLPVFDGDIKSTEAGSSQPQKSETGKILVVDDEESVRSVTGKMLEKLGYDVLYASDGREAVYVFQQHFQIIKCVMLDLTMPVMDGIEASTRILKIDPKARIIVSSGFTRDAIMKEFGEIPIAGMLHKPYSLDDISSEFKKVFSL